MSFLSPWALALGATAAFPILLHLLRRDTRKRMAFPAIRYLRRARERSAKRLAVRDRLLLLTRVAVVALIALAASGPLLGRGGAADHVPSDIAIVVDNTASMSRLVGDETLLDRQRSRAMALLEVARAGDRFWVVPALGSALAHGASAGAAGRALEGIVLTEGSADLVARARDALRLLPRGGSRPREVVLMSDFQASSWSATPLALPTDVRVVGSMVPAGTENRAVVRLRIDPPTPGSEGAALVAIGPDEALAADTTEVRLTADGQTVALARVSPGEDAVLRFSERGPGEHRLAAEITPSGLRADDRRFAVYRSLDPPILHHEGPAAGYLGRALETLAVAERLRLSEEPGDAPVWVVEGVPSADVASSRPGVSILVPPTDPGLLARFNARLESIGVPWTVELTEVGGGTSLPSVPGIPGLEAVRVDSPYRLRSMGTDSAIVRAEDGSPWVVGGRSGDRRYLLLGSPLAEGHTDLPVTAAMVPFVEVLLFRWAALGGSLPEPVDAGSPVSLPSDAASVHSPAGEIFEVDGGDAFVPLSAGVHTILHRDGTNSLLAVNVPLAESDLRALSAEEIGSTFGASDVAVADSDAEWRRLMYGSRRGTWLTPWILAMVVAFVWLEARLATPTERFRSARPTRPDGVRP